jgi:hypothetical protein
MGTILRLAKIWGFSYGNDTERAYKKVFTGFEDRLGAIFRDECLRWLKALRNAIVHNATYADREFCRLVEKHPLFSSVEEGQRIPIDGGTIGTLVNAAALQAESLVGFVDEWLKNNAT